MTSAIRQRMTMRATVTRDESSRLDPYGTRIPHEADIAGALLPCYVQPRHESTITGDGKFMAVTVLWGWFPADADVRNEDVLGDVTDRAGRVLYEGQRRLTALVKHETHLEAILEAYG